MAAGSSSPPARRHLELHRAGAGDFAVVPATPVMIASTRASPAARNLGVNGTRSTRSPRPGPCWPNATALPKLRSGPVEAIWPLRTTRSSAVKARKAAINQMHSVLVGAPDKLRASMAGLTRGALVGHCARLRVDVSRIGEPAAAAKIVLRRLARRVQMLDDEIAETDEQMADLVAETAPATSGISGVGTQATAQLLMTAGDNPHLIGSEAALARLCGTAPIPASSGTTTRYRLHRGGDRKRTPRAGCHGGVRAVDRSRGGYAEVGVAHYMGRAGVIMRPGVRPDADASTRTIRRAGSG